MTRRERIDAAKIRLADLILDGAEIDSIDLNATDELNKAKREIERLQTRIKQLTSAFNIKADE